MYSGLDVQTLNLATLTMKVFFGINDYQISLGMSLLVDDESYDTMWPLMTLRKKPEQLW